MTVSKTKYSQPTEDTTDILTRFNIFYIRIFLQLLIT